MPIILVSSVPIDALKNCELEVAEEGQEAPVADSLPPVVTYYGRPVRRYEPRPVVYRHGKPCLLRLVRNQEKED